MSTIESEMSRKIGGKPTHILKHPRTFEKNGKKTTYWDRVGVAWQRPDGTMSIQLECMPLDGHIVAFAPKDKD